MACRTFICDHVQCYVAMSTSLASVRIHRILNMTPRHLAVSMHNITLLRLPHKNHIIPVYFAQRFLLVLMLSLNF